MGCLRCGQLLTQGRGTYQQSLKNGVPLSHDRHPVLPAARAFAKTATEALKQFGAAYHESLAEHVASHRPNQEDLLAEPQYFFSGDGTLAFLLVRPVKEKDSFTAAQKSVEPLRVDRRRRLQAAVSATWSSA